MINYGENHKKERYKMKDATMKVEQRLKNMTKFYLKTGELIDKLPDGIPKKGKNFVKEKILGDTQLKELMEGLEAHRPPRLFLIGRTGVGKSSLVNALCGAYVASVSDTKSCTKKAEIHQCMDGNRVLMEILDTRGIAESESLDDKISAEDMLIAQVNEFSPDVAIFMLNCTHRDDVDSDVLFLKKLANQYRKDNGVDLPIVAVVNKCDEMAPSRFKTPSEYPQNKIDKIQEVVRYYKSIIVKNGLKIEDIIAVSSLIDWQTPDGMEVGVEDIENLPKKDIENLQIAFDGRYHIEELLDILEDAILDSEAQMGLRMASRLTEVVHNLAKRLTEILSGIAATIAVTPIPVADMYVLIILQAILVSLVASLSGRDISLDTAKEFILSLGGIAGAGYAFRMAAQQATKLLNVVFMGAGSTISASIAFLGTYAIGEAAIAYYIDEQDMEEVRKIFERSKKDKKRSKITDLVLFS